MPWEAVDAYGLRLPLFSEVALYRNVRRGLQKTKDALAETQGLICMSRDWQHPLLWAHYADKHKGLCLGLDVTDKYFHEVDYVPDGTTLNLETLAVVDEDDIPIFMKRKFDGWEYETEYRAFIRLKDADPVSDHFFLPFSSDLKLAQVIVGARSEVSRAKLARVLGDLQTHVRSFKSRAGFQNFKVVENRRKAAWR